MCISLLSRPFRAQGWTKRTIDPDAFMLTRGGEPVTAQLTSAAVCNADREQPTEFVKSNGHGHTRRPSPLPGSMTCHAAQVGEWLTKCSACNEVKYNRLLPVCIARRITPCNVPSRTIPPGLASVSDNPSRRLGGSRG